MFGQPLRWGYQRSVPLSAARSLYRAGSPHPWPLSHAAGEGELVGGIGIVDRRRRRIATAMLTFPLPFLHGERKGAGGKGEGRQVCAAAQMLKPLQVFDQALRPASGDHGHGHDAGQVATYRGTAPSCPWWYQGRGDGR